MKTLGIILTLAAVCVIQTLSASTPTTTTPTTTTAAPTPAGSTVAGNGIAAATSAPDITVNLNMTFSGTWDPIYSNESHPNTTDLKAAICKAVKANANKVKTCSVSSLSQGSIVASLTLTAASGETSANVKSQVDTAKANIANSVMSDGYNVGTITGVVDTTSTATTTAPSAATTLSASFIMYLTVLCATAKAVLF